MRCKHENADHLMPGDRIEVYDVDILILRGYAQCEQLRCIDCGTWLPLGESNDSGCEVEIEAARRAHEWRVMGNVPTGYDRFDWCPDMRGDWLCERCEAIYLARVICEHKDEP